MKNHSIIRNTASLSEWLLYIRSLHSKNIDMNLKRIRRVAEKLDILKPSAFVFTVAGTNGKGTTCCMLEEILLSAGYKVGVYTSPHLIRYTERVRVNNAELPETEHTASFIEIEAARGNISLTCFEYSTLSALLIFKKLKLDIIILEVGLGGRLDATNIIDTDVAIITSIALDHTDWLGSDRESIGREKSGIFRADKPAVIGEPNIPNSILQIAKEKRAQLLRYKIDWNFSVLENTWFYIYKKNNLLNLPIPYVPQPNAATALAALYASSLKIDEQAIRKGIQNAILPGRFQIVSESPRLILDVAHNPHAAMYLAERLKSMTKTGHVLAVVGMLCNKDISGTLNCMKNVVDKWYCAPLKIPKGASAEQLISHLDKDKGRVYESIGQAWDAAMTDAGPEDIVLVFGSFHTVSCIMKMMNRTKISIR